MRVDANVSVRRRGTSELGTKVEVKNMNSLRSLGRAIEYEIERQTGMLGTGERIVQETRHWDEADGRTHGMRTKEGSSDYRYFPEPDLVPVAPTDAMRASRHAPTSPSSRPPSGPDSCRSGGSASRTPACSSTCPASPSTRRRPWSHSGRGRPRYRATSRTGAPATCSRT